VTTRPVCAHSTVGIADLALRRSAVSGGVVFFSEYKYAIHGTRQGRIYASWRAIGTRFGRQVGFSSPPAISSIRNPLGYHLLLPLLLCQTSVSSG
jgi:hypothetical protein